MATQILEGTWEEVMRHAKILVGRKVRVTILEDNEISQPNQHALEILNKISKRQKGKRETSGENTLKMIRDARSGGMFGDASDN
jgi:hypothetical protein